MFFRFLLLSHSLLFSFTCLLLLSLSFSLFLSFSRSLSLSFALLLSCSRFLSSSSSLPRSLPPSLQLSFCVTFLLSFSPSLLLSFCPYSPSLLLAFSPSLLLSLSLSSVQAQSSGARARVPTCTHAQVYFALVLIALTVSARTLRGFPLPSTGGTGGTWRQSTGLTLLHEGSDQLRAYTGHGFHGCPMKDATSTTSLSRETPCGRTTVCATLSRDALLATSDFRLLYTLLSHCSWKVRGSRHKLSGSLCTGLRRIRSR